MFALLKLHLSLHVFLQLFRGAFLLNTIEYLLLEEYTTGYLQGEHENYLMTLSQRPYSLYPAGSVMYRVYYNNTTILK